MITNKSLFRATTFQEKIQHYQDITKQYKWRGAIAHPLSVLVNKERLLVVVQAIDAKTFQFPSRFDWLNCQLQLHIIKRAMPFKAARRHCAAYLAYSSGIKIEVNFGERTPPEINQLHLRKSLREEPIPAEAVICAALFRGSLTKNIGKNPSDPLRHDQR